MDASALHADAIVIDATCPLAREPAYLDWWREGGATVIAPTVRGFDGDARSGLAEIGRWHRHVREHPDTMLVLAPGDIERAKREGRLGLVLHVQGTAIFEDDLDLVDGFQAAGLRMAQLCYNRRNLFGDGATERSDGGLSHLGIELVRRLDAARIVVDCAHTGERTSFDAVEHARGPVVISHANARGLHDNARNVSDALIRAIAESGGLVGTVGFPAFLTWDPRPSLDRFIDDIAYKAELVGIEHTGIGIDYYLGQHPVEDDERARARYEAMIRQGHWRAGEYPPPPYYYPAGIETPRTLGALTTRLLERGFTERETRAVLGTNWQRVLERVWGG
ncbi:MAG: membrane dipeptidase [Ectothiorhodospiraceae bacterium]|nr:membrane dipeptidase [Ectothiorhodospiraceae bacterium]